MLTSPKVVGKIQFEFALKNPDRRKYITEKDIDKDTISILEPAAGVGNFILVDKDEVDDIKMENVFVSESSYTPIDGEFELDGIGTEGELYFLPFLEKEPDIINDKFICKFDNKEFFNNFS